MLSNNNDYHFRKRLEQSQTMEQFLNVCAEFYDFKNCKLGPIAKVTLIQNIGKVITLAGAKPK